MELGDGKYVNINIIVFNFNDFKYGFVHRKTILRRFLFIKFMTPMSIFQVVFEGNEASANLRFVSLNKISDRYVRSNVSKTFQVLMYNSVHHLIFSLLFIFF